MPRVAFLLGSTALALCAAVPARAQDTYFPPILQPPPADSPPPQDDASPPPADDLPAALAPGPDVYTPADFAQYAPRSALDMLQQVPGFNIQESFGQGRGLGEATGNVLLNGERISSKSDTVTQRVARVTAGEVVRIELVDGATLDIPGLTGRVANIVTSRSSRWNGSGRSSAASTAQNIVVAAPMPSPRTSTTVSAKPGRWRSRRVA